MEVVTCARIAWHDSRDEYQSNTAPPIDAQAGCQLMNTIDRDQFYLREFIAPILPIGMVLAAIYLIGLWIADRLVGKQADLELALIQLGGGVVLALLAWACRRVALQGSLHATAAISITYGGIFAASLAMRSWIDHEGLLTVLPASMMTTLVGSIFAQRVAHLLIGFVVTMAPAVILALRMDPSISNEGAHVPYVLIFTALTVLPLYHLTGIIKQRYYTALAEQQERAMRDPLTALLNRTAWCERAEVMLTRAEAEMSGIALLYLDVDHFKQINDRIGHAMGDDVLRQTAGLLAREFPPGALLSRYGGEEFVVMLAERGLEDAARCAEHVRATLAMETAGDIAVTISAGVAFHAPGESLDELLHRADLALLRAKALGRDRVEIAARPFAPRGERLEPTPVASPATGRGPRLTTARRALKTNMARPT
jgi:diguanylate cyclase (GGDEF)-like protein